MMKATVALSLAFGVTLAFADTVQLKSGSTLKGTVAEATKDAIVFDAEDFGKVTIKVANIVKLESVGEHVIQYADNTEQKQALSIVDGAYQTGATKLDIAAVKAIDPVAETWHGSVNLAFNAARGNTYANSAAVIANANRRWEKDRLNLDFGYYFSENGQVGNDSQKTEDRWEIEAKHDHFWLPKVYHYENLKWERDMIQDLRARYRVGLGGGYQWLENTVFESTGKWNFNQELGLNYIKEEFDQNDDVKDNGFCALRYGHHLDFVPKCAESIEFFHNLEVLPEVDEWEKFLAKADVGFSTKLIYDFDLLAKIEWDYNSKPAGDRKRDDLRYLVGLGYKW